MTEETLFAEAIEKSTPAERAAFLDEACRGDAVLRRRVEALLQSHAREDFLKTPAIQRAAEVAGGGPIAGATEAEGPGDDAESALDFLAPTERPDSLGRLGHYEVREVIGRGGMGVVLRAFDEKLHRVVAIKVMAAQLATNATARKRFTREAQAQAAVSHDHIVTIHAVEEANGLPYLVMQYVAGMSLQQRLEKSGPLQLHEVLRIGMQTASALAAAHAQGLVHRDVKPANILLENGVERVKITDFGLARAATEASLTQSGVVTGTPQYMSPEQAEGKAIDQRTDLFSLGSVLYAMCTGRAPFRASGTMAVLKRVCEEMPTPIRETNPDVPDWLVAIIDRLHAKDPDQRYQSAAEVAELLGRHLAHVQHPSIVGQVANLPQDLAGGKLAPWRRRLAVAAAVLLCLVGVISLSEATGVTKLRSTMIRIFTPDGTLVVEADDPGVKVTVEGDGGVVITGAGLEEIRLRPGSYTVHANRDGKRVPLEREVVSIARGGREIVKVKLEAAGPAPVPADRVTPLLKSATPILVMPFDKADFYEKDGRTYVRDRSGNGHDGLCEQVQFTPQGKRGGGLANAGKGFLRLPTSLVANRSQFTIAAWVKSTNLNKSWAVYTCHQKDYPASNLPSFNFFCTNHLYAGAWNAASDWVHATALNANISSGEWVFVAITLENGAPGKGRLRLMLNDRLAERPFQQIGGVPLEGIQDLAALALEGVFDELAVWDRALSEQELHELFALGHAPAGKVPAAKAAVKADAQPFVVLDSKASIVAKFDTLAEAVQGASDGDTIEVRGNGPFVCDRINITQALTIRAGEGFRPVINLTVTPKPLHQVGLATVAPLVLEGLEFRVLDPGESKVSHTTIVPTKALRVANCRFSTGFLCLADFSTSPSSVWEVRNCEFLGDGSRAVSKPFAFGHKVILENCVSTMGCSIRGGALEPKEPSLQLTRNTFRTNNTVEFVDETDKAHDFEDAKQKGNVLLVKASGNVFDSHYVLVFSKLPPAKILSPADAENYLARVVGWKGERNLYSVAGQFLTLYHSEKGLHDPAKPIKTLVDWKQFWTTAEDNSIEGLVRYQGGDLLAKVKLSPEKVTPEDFRLRADSAGYRAGKDGKDLGADVDLVGPGPAYERWKQTPEYQQWLKDTGQAKK